MVCVKTYIWFTYSRFPWFFTTCSPTTGHTLLDFKQSQCPHLVPSWFFDQERFLLDLSLTCAASSPRAVSHLPISDKYNRMLWMHWCLETLIFPLCILENQNRFCILPRSFEVEKNHHQDSGFLGNPCPLGENISFSLFFPKLPLQQIRLAATLQYLTLITMPTITHKSCLQQREETF